MCNVRPGGKAGTNSDFLMCNQSIGLNWNKARGGGRKAGVRGLMDHWLEYLLVPSTARGNDTEEGEAWRDETRDAELRLGHSKSKIPTGLGLEWLHPGGKSSS